MPIVIQRQIPLLSLNQATKHVEILHPKYIEQGCCSAHCDKRQVSPSLNQATKHVETPQTQFFDQGVGVPTVIQRQAPQIQNCAEDGGSLARAVPACGDAATGHSDSDSGEDGVCPARAVQRQNCGRASDPSVDADTGPSASDCGEGGGSLALAVHRQNCGHAQESIWCIFEDACYDTKSLPQPDGVAGALAWLTSRRARVDQPCDTRDTAFACAGRTKRRRNGDEVLYSPQQQVGRVTSDAWTTAMVYDMVLPITSSRLLWRALPLLPLSPSLWWFPGAVVAFDSHEHGRSDQRKSP